MGDKSKSDKRKLEKMKTHAGNEMLEGFDIELGKEVKHRIDRLVDNYESDIVARLNQEAPKSKRSDQAADAIASFGGSWKFIGIMASILVFWIVWNILPFTPIHFDPKPYILLNLVLSFTAAFQAPIIMMSQNRQAARDKNESVVDFAINYKAEQEINDMQSHLHRIESQINEVKGLLAELSAKQNSELLHS